VRVISTIAQALGVETGLKSIPDFLT